MGEGFATDPRVVADQAAMVAAAWSPPGAPASWALTAAQFAALRDDPELQAIAATIPPERLPPLLFAAAASSLVLELEPEPLREWFPRVGSPQPALGDDFPREYRAFCLDHRERLLELCAGHRYQMNEVGRCADLLPALAPSAGDREIALIDIGTGAGLALHLDRYRYVFWASDGGPATVGDPSQTSCSRPSSAADNRCPRCRGCRASPSGWASTSSRWTSATRRCWRGWPPACPRRSAR